MGADLELIKFGAKCEMARRRFFHYCKCKSPDFYNEDRPYIVNLCNDLQDFYESDEEVLVINMPPRHGKSRTASLFVEWVLGHNINEKIMTGSYNETLSTSFSKNVRNDIIETKADKSRIVFSDIFPNVRIKKGDGSMNLWSLEGGYNNYLATSPTGTATGFGASLLIIDDLIKNAEEAYNEGVKEKHWDWFTNTMLSRLEEGGKIIIIMTRWASDDLAGRALLHFESQDIKIKHINMKALQDDGTMLCDAVLSKKSYDMKVKAMGEDIASANYQQIPIDLKGALYTRFNTYSKLPDKIRAIKNYTDTADAGADYLCSITYAECDNEAYIIDIVYTKEPMEVTENLVAQMLYNTGCNKAYIESNNGGRSFARNVERILRDKYNSNKCSISWFHQSKNKEARIYSNSSWVMDHIYYPENWRFRFPDFYKDTIKYQREGKNSHDDNADALTGVAEQFNKPKRFTLINTNLA